MRHLDCKLAATLLLALGLGACNPFDLTMPEPGSTSRQNQKAANSVELPATEAGSTQVTLVDSIPDDHGCRPQDRRAHGTHSR